MEERDVEGGSMRNSSTKEVETGVSEMEELAGEIRGGGKASNDERWAKSVVGLWST